MTRLTDAASPEEVEAAILALTKSELLGIRRCGNDLLAPAGGLLRGRDVDDLISEAMTLALDGTRGWPAGRVDFVGFLRQTMWSIASGWYERRDTNEAGETFLATRAEPGSLEALGSAASTPAMQVRYVLAREALANLKHGLASDPAALEVLEGLEAGYSGTELKEVLEISETELQTRKRRISRLARKLRETDGRTDP